MCLRSLFMTEIPYRYKRPSPRDDTNGMVISTRTILTSVFVVLFAAVSLLAIQSSISGVSPSGPRSPLWGKESQCTLDHDHSSATGYAVLDVFTADGNYLPRTHCMTTQTGETDWLFVWILVALNAIIITGYFRIFAFWRKAYLQEELHDRNKKLMDLAWIFLFCAICGYVSSIVLFFWPAYRFLALMLVPLGFFTWKFALNLEDFKVSLSAKRLSRQLTESLSRENAALEAKVLEATTHLRIAKERAENADRAKSDFLASMSHEIRTPLTAIIGFTDIVIEKETHCETRKDEILTIKKNSVHLLNLINDILDVTQIESGSVEYERVPCSIREIVTEVLDMMSVKAKLKGTGIHVNVHKSIPQLIITDPTRVKQLVTNLVENSVKFTDLGDIFIEIMPALVTNNAVEPDDQCVFTITVRDTGVGISPSRLDAIFDSFTQESSSTRREFGGTGLGLAISRRIARDLGGDLVVQSDLGIGSAFTCTLTAQRVDAELKDTTVSKSDKKNSGHNLNHSRLLLVEDGPDNRKLITHHFNRIGVHLDTAHDGVLALEKFNKAIEDGSPYDLVLMDISMPNMDGIECTKLLRSQGYAVPIVMLTAHILKEERDRCYAIGATAYHCKPIDFPHLFRTCAELLDQDSRDAA